MEMRVVGKKDSQFTVPSTSRVQLLYIHLINMNFYDQFVYNPTSEKRDKRIFTF